MAKRRKKKVKWTRANKLKLAKLRKEESNIEYQIRKIEEAREEARELGVY